MVDQWLEQVWEIVVNGGLAAVLLFYILVKQIPKQHELHRTERDAWQKLMKAQADEFKEALDKRDAQIAVLIERYHQTHLELHESNGQLIEIHHELKQRKE